MRVHVVPTVSEGGYKEPKDHGLRIGHILGSPSPKKNNKMQTLWKGGMRKALTEHNKQSQAYGICHASLEL